MKLRGALLALALAAPARAALIGQAAPHAPLSVLPVLPPSAVAGAQLLTPPALAAAPLGIFQAPSAPLAAPSAVPAAAARETPGAAAAAVVDRVELAARLAAHFARLDESYPLPQGSSTARVRANVRAQLLAAARDYADPEIETLETVAREADRSLELIQRRLDAREIDPARRVRLSESDSEPPEDEHAHIGVYPVAADPFQWGHLLIALRAVGELGLDKVVFVLAGDDQYKPNITPVALRHPMGQAVLADFAPFFAYSPIAVGTTLDGETNIFRLLALNPGRRVDAWYMVGDDHYRLVKPNGDPDTLPKLEANLVHPHGHSPTLHALKVAFIERERPEGEVPTTLEVRFLQHVGFDASSTQARRGRHVLMPYSAYDYARRYAPGLYGLAPVDDSDDGD